MFWTSEELISQAQSFIVPFNNDRVVNSAYELSLGQECFVGSSEMSGV